MYHVIGTVLTVSLLYTISFIFYRTGFYSQVFHRKFWNSVLAFTFLFTALAGLLLALQVNYKWNIHITDIIRKWHVEIGICLTLTGIFHLLWHITYFTEILKPKKILSEPRKVKKTAENSEISYNLFLVGFTSTSVQILLMREIMNIAGGYELITGLYLGSWLIASSIGSTIAGRSALNDIRRINLVFSISPFISLFLLILLSRLFLNPGETPSIMISMILTFLILVPFCLISGFTFIKLTSLAKSGNDWLPGTSFSIETAGGIIAGIILSLLTSGILNTGQILLVILMLHLAYTLLSFFIHNKRNIYIIKSAFVIATALIIVLGPDVFIRQLLMPGIKVTGTRDTPYGNITEGIYGQEQSTYYNHRLLIYPADAADREENIHYALLQRENTETVLLISGSLKSCLPELSKYQLKKVTYVESDPGLIKNQSFKNDTLPFAVDIRIRDAFRFVRSSKENFDAVILLLPPPSTLALNRFFTAEFFQSIKKLLTPGGVFMCSPGPGDYYMNKESITLYSSVFNSLAEVFSYIKPVAGNKLYFIASDQEVSVSFCEMVEKRQIENIYVSPDFMSDDLIQRKSEEILSVIDRNTRQNRSAFPVASFLFQSYNLSRDPVAKSTGIFILIILFALSFLTIRRNNILMYAGASSLAGFEIIMLLILQLTIGNMYQLSAILIAAMMAGLAAGSGMNLTKISSVPVRVLALFLILFYVVTALGLKLLLSITSSVLAILTIIVLIIPPSFITGHIFRKLTVSDVNGSVSASVYSADLAGSAFGFTLISGFVVPVYGIRISIFLLSGLIFAGILFGTNRNK